jgi:hypothetical protein
LYRDRKINYDLFVHDDRIAESIHSFIHALTNK